MAFSSFAIRVVFLALPGIVGAKLYKKLRGPSTRRRWEDLVEVLLFALLSYAIWGVGAWLWSSEGADVASKQQGTSVVKAFTDEASPLDWEVIVYSTLISILLALASAYNHTYSLLMRLSRFIRATRRTGDEDIWEVFLNSPVTTWCVVRDHKHNLMYYGFVRHYSDSEKQRELVLENVTVYTNDSGERIYTTGAMYLSREPNELTIEVPPGLLSRDAREHTQSKG